VKDDGYMPSVPIRLNNLKDQIPTAIAETDQTLLQNVWHEVEYRLDVCRVTNITHIKLA
jgi:hypothetical protein